MNRFVFLFITLFFLQSCFKESPKGELIFTEANPSEGFNYPYFLFIPEGTPIDKELVIIVEPNISGFVDDNLKKHIEKAKRTATKDFYIGNYVAQKLKNPLIIPVFPRSKRNWKIYTHSLDRDVMQQKDNQLERIDLQLLAMFNDARSKLKELNMKTNDQFLMTGFSASATFVNRFTLLHPNKVKAVAAGRLNGLLALPLDSIGNKKLNYPLGTNNFKKSFNIEFQKSNFLDTPQFYFMGENDDNDVIPYNDAFDEDERALIYELLGKEMLPERWKTCKNIYKNEGANADIKTYKNIGHEHPETVKQEVVEFFSDVMEK